MKITAFLKRLSSYQLLVLFIFVYLLIIAFMRPNPATLSMYHLDQPSYRVLLLTTLALPSILVWIAAFYGYEQLRLYAALLPGTKEGAAFNKIVRGIRWLTIYLPIPAIFALLLSAVANVAPGFRGASIALSTYIAIIFALVAFTILSTGSRWLADQGKTRPTTFKTRLASLAFIVMGVLYCYFVFKHTAKGLEGYQLSAAWAALTVVIPFFFAWFMGLLAVLDLDAYASKAPGVLYKRALSFLSGGVLIVITSSILMQYINSVNTVRGRLVLDGLLLMRYILAAGLVVGFVLLAFGAKKLQQIEKI